MQEQNVGISAPKSAKILASQRYSERNRTVSSAKESVERAFKLCLYGQKAEKTRLRRFGLSASTRLPSERNEISQFMHGLKLPDRTRQKSSRRLASNSPKLCHFSGLWRDAISYQRQGPEMIVTGAGRVFCHRHFKIGCRRI